MGQGQSDGSEQEPTAEQRLQSFIYHIHESRRPQNHSVALNVPLQKHSEATRRPVVTVKVDDETSPVSPKENRHACTIRHRRTISVPQAPSQMFKSPTIPRSGNGRETTIVVEANRLNLNNIQISMVWKAWANSRESGENQPGLEIFKRILSWSSEIRKLFGFDNELGELARSQKSLQKHARMFTTSLDDIISNLNDDQAIRKKITDLGKKHVNFRAIGFETSYWDVFARAMIECGLGGDRGKATDDAWRQIVVFMINGMKDGYYEEAKRVRKQHWSNLLSGKPSENGESTRKSSNCQPRTSQYLSVNYSV